MKKIIYLSLIMLSTLLGACRETPTDSQLDAQWQLLSITDAAGQTTYVEPTYWSFYRHTAELRSPGEISVLANLTYIEGETLSMTFPDNTVAQLTAVALPAVTDVAPDTKGYTYTFAVENIGNKTMTLRYTNGSVYAFRKY